MGIGLAVVFSSFVGGFSCVSNTEIRVFPDAELAVCRDAVKAKSLGDS